MKRTVKIKLTIPAGQTTSAPFSIENCSIWGILFPAAFDGVGPSISFQTAGSTFSSASPPASSDFKDAVDTSGAALSVSVQLDKVVTLAPNTALAQLLASAAWIRVVASATQSAARDIYLLGTVDAS